jgi:hypothetical protein
VLRVLQVGTRREEHDGAGHNHGNEEDGNDHAKYTHDPTTLVAYAANLGAVVIHQVGDLRITLA